MNIIDTYNPVIKSLLALIRMGIGNESGLMSDRVDWEIIKNLAARQELTAVVLDGIEALRKGESNVSFPEKKVLTQWIGEVLQGYEYRYELYRRAIAEMAGFFNRHGYKIMILKGYACSLDWPKPEHRPCGDIDIWQFGKQMEADELLAKEKNIDIDSSHHHHTVYFWRDFMVENHYDFVNVHDYKSSIELERIFKVLGKDDSYSTELYGEKVYLPSPNLHALFLIRHLVAHFASTSITLRQLLDWAFFAKTHVKTIDWEWLQEVLTKFKMRDVYNCFNGICVEDLGFDSSMFNGVTFNPPLKDRVLNDILNPKYGVVEPDGFLKKLSYKLQRWNSNTWKRQLCYEDNKIEAFIRNVWAHIIKPSSFWSNKRHSGYD